MTLGAREDGAPDADISVPSASVCTTQEHDVFYIFNQKEKQLRSLERSFQSIITRCFWKEKDTRTLSLQLQRIKSLHICSLRQQLLQNHLILPNVLKLGQQFSPDRRDGFILGGRCQVWVYRLQLDMRDVSRCSCLHSLVESLVHLVHVSSKRLMTLMIYAEW